MYALWNTISAGWLTNASTYSTDRTRAKRFTEEAALEMCRLHYRTGMSEFTLLPVDLTLLDAITGATND